MASIAEIQASLDSYVKSVKFSRFGGVLAVVGALSSCSSASSPAPATCVEVATPSGAPTIAKPPASPVGARPAATLTAPAIGAPDAGKRCTSDAECAGAICAELACRAGQCAVTKPRANYTPCGSADEQRRCFGGVCYEPNDCAAQCGRLLALDLAAEMAATFPNCTGSKASECRAKVLQDERHPLRIKAQARAEACLVDCGYPTLALPDSVP